MKPTRIAFCTSCRIALGKLRRTTNIVEALRDISSEFHITLLANSDPNGVAKGLSRREVGLYDQIEFAKPHEMADRLRLMDLELVIVGTMALRDIETLNTPLCLTLREVMPNQLEQFRLKDGRPWDLVLLPHPEGHWTPDPNIIRAKRIEAVGWIYRQPTLLRDAEHASGSSDTEKDPPTVLLTTGGGSGEDRGNDTQTRVAELIRGLRGALDEPLKVVQIIGPRDRKRNIADGVDETMTPGPNLYNHFQAVDLVISAVGYNTVLELACTNVPALLVPVPRFTDDQELRARQWGNRLGLQFEPDRVDDAIEWMSAVLRRRQRRPVVPLGPSGARRAAELIDELALS